MNVSKIVVAYDASKQSNKAIEWAIDLAGKYQAEVTIVTVVKPPEFSPIIGEVDEFYADAEKYFQPILEKITKDWEEYGVEINTKILRGHPAESVIQFAAENKASLIITGGRGMGGFKKLILGSVAQKIVSYSKIPVLTIKE